MVAKNLIAAVPLILANFIPSVIACPGHVARDANTSAGPPITFGSDAPSDPATTGYFINHFALNVKNITASINFYHDVFGLRELFTLQASKHLAIAYMGHSQGGRNGTGYQTTQQLNLEKNNNAGLIELICLDVPKNHLPASSEKPNAFAHIGMVVPDIQATQARLEKMPVKIIKPYGKPVAAGSAVSLSFGLSPAALAQVDAEERQIIEQVLGAIDSPFIYVQDPDGNVIEIQSQN